MSTTPMAQPPMPGGAATPPGPSTPRPMPGNQAVAQFRKALGVPEDQPAPEQMVIDACIGKLGPELKRMASAVVGERNVQPETTPDSGQPGGESAPPDPNGPDTGDTGAVQPGADTDGKMGSATIFGRRPVSSIGDQNPGAGGPSDEPEEDDDKMPTSARMFRRPGR